MDKPMIPYASRYVPDLPCDKAAEAFYQTMKLRRSVRQFSDRPISRQTIEQLIRAAGSAPSGANKQPWRFVCINDPTLKRQVREAAEQQERAFYDGRAGDRWLNDLEKLGTGPSKPFLESAPWLIAVFRLVKGDDGSQVYYPVESVGLATGLLLTAAHHAGLATLTYTPSPMKFLCEVLNRPDNERPTMLIPIGYPTDDCQVPSDASKRKPLNEIMVVHEKIK